MQEGFYNETAMTFQINISFDADHIIGCLLTDQDNGQLYKVVNGEPLYYRKNNKVYEEVDVRQKKILTATGDCASEKLLYRNRCEIGYPLPDGTNVIEKG